MIKLAPQQGFDASPGRCPSMSVTSKAFSKRSFLSKTLPKQWRLSGTHDGKKLRAQFAANVPPPPSGAVESQQRAIENANIFSFLIRGVSFDGRQQPLRACHQGQAVMLVHEPSNPHDDHAKAIKMLDGTTLGYVPKDINRLNIFHRPESFAHIDSLGVATNTHDPELLGARVIHRQIEPLTALALPDRLRTACLELDTFMPDSLRESICNKAIHSAQGRCFISRADKEPLVVVPIWREDEARKVFSLVNFWPISETLKTAQDNFLDQDSSDSQALSIYRQMNLWTDKEVKMYRMYKKGVAEARNEEHWRLDLSLLKAAMEIPSFLKDLEVENAEDASATSTTSV